MEYINVKDAATLWNLAERRIRVLCAKGKIEGVVKDGYSYLIPADTQNPAYGGHLRGAVIPQEFFSLFTRLDSLKQKLGDIPLPSEGFCTRFICDSNAIEGNSITLGETTDVLAGSVIDKKPLKDHFDIVGQSNAFNFITNLVQSGTELSENMIRDVHALTVMCRPQDRGSYRTVPVEIPGATLQPPQPNLVPAKMEQLLLSQKNTRRHPVHGAAVFHLEFEGIHPFIEGNGRTGRLLLNFMLMKSGYPPVNIRPEDRDKYFGCFESYFREGTTVPLVTLIAEDILGQLAALTE